MLIGVDNDHVPDDDNVNSHLASKDRATSKGVEELPGAKHLDNNQPVLIFDDKAICLKYLTFCNTRKRGGGHLARLWLSF